MKNFILFLASLMFISCGSDNSQAQNKPVEQNYQIFASDTNGGSKLKKIQVFKNKKPFETAFSKIFPNKKPPSVDFKKHQVVYLSNGLSQFSYSYEPKALSQKQPYKITTIQSNITNCNATSLAKKSSFAFMTIQQGRFLIDEVVTNCDQTSTKAQNISFSILHYFENFENLTPNSTSKGRDYELINDSARFAQIYPKAIPDINFNEFSVLFLQSGSSSSTTEFSVEKIEKVGDKTYVYIKSEFLGENCPSSPAQITPTLFIKFPKSENVFFKDSYSLTKCEI